MSIQPTETRAVAAETTASSTTKAPLRPCYLDGNIDTLELHAFPMTKAGNAAPIVTVVMTAYNEAGSVGRAIQSVLAQTFNDWELLFVDDGSTDGTDGIAARLHDQRITVIRHLKNTGIAASRNEAIVRARGKYIAIFDADDFSYPDRLERQVRLLDAHSDIALCGTSGYMHAGNSAKYLCSQPTDPQEIHRWILRTCPVINSSVMARAGVLKEYLYDTSLARGEDYDLFLRIAKHYSIANLSDPLIEFETSFAWRYKLIDQWWKLRVRWRALARHGYSWSQAYWLLAFIPTLLVPERLKFSLRKNWIASVSSPFLKALGFITGSYTLARFGALAAQVWAGKALGTYEYGAANVVIAFSALIQIGLMLGFPITLSKYLASENSSEAQTELISTSLGSLLVWNAAVISILFAARGFVQKHRLIPSELYSLSLCYAGFAAVYMTVTSTLQGLKRFTTRGQVETVYGIGTLLFFLSFLLLGIRSHVSLIAAFCAALGFCTLWTLWLIRDHLRLTWSISALKQIGSYSLIGVAAPLSMALTIAPARIVLNHYFPMREVGILSAYFTSSVQIALSFLYMLSTVLIPSASTEDGQRHAWAKMPMVVPSFLIGGGLLFCATCAGALLLYGKSYPLRWDWVVLFGITAGVILLHGTVSSLFSARGLQGLSIAAAGSLLAGVGNLVLNLWLTPKWGISGAALSLGLAYSAALIGYFFLAPLYADGKP